MQEFTSVPAIVVLCYFAATVYKSFAPEPAFRHIPSLCMAIGLIMGVLAFLFVPDFIHGDNVFTAAAIGVVNGLATVGGHQTHKQYKD